MSDGPFDAGDSDLEGFRKAFGSGTFNARQGVNDEVQDRIPIPVVSAVTGRRSGGSRFFVSGFCGAGF